MTKREGAADSHKGEQTVTNQSMNKSDRFSDNDSNASSSGKVAMKKPTKNKEQRTSKPFRPSKRVFDEKDDNLKKWYHKMTDGQNKLKSQLQLRTYLQERYQQPIASQMASILSPRF